MRGALALVPAAAARLLLAGLVLFAVLPADTETAAELLPVRLAAWLWQMLSGAWGVSAQLGLPVAQLVRAALPATLELAGLALAVCAAAGLGGGMLLFAWRREGRRHEGRAALAEAGTALMMSVPVLLWALGLLLVLGLALEAVPVAGRLAPELAWPEGSGFLLADALLAGDGVAFASGLAHLLVPAAALGLAFAPPVMRVLGAALVAAYGAPYARQARLRGLSKARVLLGEALPVAAVPALAALGRQFGLLLGAAAVVEAACGFPGLGRLLVEAVRARDVPVLQAAGLAFAAVAVLGDALAAGLCRALGPEPRR